MEAPPPHDPVAHQYQKWSYPAPIFDISKWLAEHWQWFDPTHAHRLLWPNQTAYLPELDILVAGCGNNQAAVLAYTNPLARIVAIDVSQSPLDHHRWLKKQYGLKNLELFNLPIEEVDQLNHQFDLIVSTGVLHHLEDPKSALSALGQCLRPDGVVAIMLYARNGRLGVEMMQTVFRDLGLKQDQPSLQMVKEAIGSLPAVHPLRPYLEIAPDLESDAGWIDTFLNVRDRSYTVEDCLNLVKSAGLVFQDWFLKSPYYPPLSVEGGFYAALANLPEARQWSVMERINTQNACHFFTACRKDRPPQNYTVDFSSSDILASVPAFRYRCGLQDEEIYRPGWRIRLNSQQLALIRHIDGQMSINAIVERAVTDDGPAEFKEGGFIEMVIQVFKMLWQRDFISIGINVALAASAP